MAKSSDIKTHAGETSPLKETVDIESQLNHMDATMD